MITPELKAKWISELRSNTHTQGKYFLHQTNGKKCCLGVLCIAAGLKPSHSSHKMGYDEKNYHVFHYDDKIASPPESLGLEPTNLTTLMNMNDSEDKTFSEIASWIEKNL